MRLFVRISNTIRKPFQSNHFADFLSVDFCFLQAYIIGLWPVQMLNKINSTIDINSELNMYDLISKLLIHTWFLRLGTCYWKNWILFEIQVSTSTAMISVDWILTCTTHSIALPQPPPPLLHLKFVKTFNVH